MSEYSRDRGIPPNLTGIVPEEKEGNVKQVQNMNSFNTDLKGTVYQPLSVLNCPSLMDYKKLSISELVRLGSVGIG